MREVRIWRPFRAGEMSQIAAVNALSDAYVTYDDYKRLAGDLDDAQTRIVELKQEIAEDAKVIQFMWALLMRRCEKAILLNMDSPEWAEDLIRQMVEMSKEEGLVNFSDWIKAAEKYLEYQKEILENLQHDQ